MVSSPWSTAARGPAEPRRVVPVPPCWTKAVDEGTAYTVPAGVSEVRVYAITSAGTADVTAGNGHGALIRP